MACLSSDSIVLYDQIIVLTKVILDSRIQETKNLLTNADRSTNKKNHANKTKFVKVKKKNFFLRDNFTPFMSKSFSILRPVFSIFVPQGFWNVQKFCTLDFAKWGQKDILTEWRNEKKFLKTFLAVAILHPLWAKVVKSETTSFHYFSPKIPKI